MPRAVAKLGIACVVCTRATTWAQFAVQSLPPREEFLAVRLGKEFELRRDVESMADDLHDAFLQNRGITQEMQIRGASGTLTTLSEAASYAGCE